MFHVIKIGDLYVSSVDLDSSIVLTPRQANAQRFDTINTADTFLASIKPRRVKVRQAIDRSADIQTPDYAFDDGI